MSGRGTDVAAVAIAATGLILAFPPIGWWPLAWVAGAPLLFRCALIPPRRALALGGVWGVVFFTFTLYWAQGVLVRYGGIPGWLAVGPVLLLVLYCAAYFAVFAWLLAAGAGRWGTAALWMAPVLWVTLECLRSRVLGGFPWAVLAVSQQAKPALLAASSWGGAYAVSALLVASWAWLAQIAHGSSSARRLKLVGAGIAVLALVAGLGAWRAGRLERLPADLRVACLQVNVPQAIKWSPAHRQRILDAHRELTRQASQAGARLVVWPESSLPFASGERVREGQRWVRIEDWVAQRARENGVDILWGGTATVRGSEGIELRNSAFFTSAAGRLASRYDKMRLVPFGEYVPARRLLWFLEPLVRQVGEFGAGEAPVLHATRAGVLGSVICYEILFPHLVRRIAVPGAGFMANITNDAWYGTAVMPYLHLAAAPLRAAENGFAVLRAANTGVSALIGPSGRVLARTRMQERTVLVGDVPARGEETFYRRHGDLLAGACAMMTVFYLVALLPRRSRSASHPQRRQS
ncbi:MAG: apolipoprotein N-acyltransferase [Acidobacteriota bacterium]